MTWKVNLAVFFCASLSTTAAVSEPQQVNAFNFARAETDFFFTNNFNKLGGLNKLVHDRVMVSIDKQAVVRMNRDTLYSGSLHDLDAGPVTAILPATPDGRYQAIQVVSQDHYSPFVIYDGELTLTKENVGTRYVLLIVRTFADPNDPEDMAAAHAAQNAITIEQASDGAFELPEWDPVSQEAARKASAALQALGGTEDKIRMGTAEEVDQLAHLMANSTGWGLNPRADAIYYTVYPDQNNGETGYSLSLSNVPVDGFWSVTVYNAEGYLVENEFDAYSLNSATSVPDDKGLVTVQFGGCDGEVPNCLPIMDGWNYSLRLYRPRAEVQRGEWRPPEPKTR